MISGAFVVVGVPKLPVRSSVAPDRTPKKGKPPTFS